MKKKVILIIGLDKNKKEGNYINIKSGPSGLQL